MKSGSSFLSRQPRCSLLERRLRPAPAPVRLVFRLTERWLSGRKHRTRNAAYGQPYRGFESHPLRHLVNLLRELDFLLWDFGRKSPLFVLFEDRGEPQSVAESPRNESFSLCAKFEVRSAFQTGGGRGCLVALANSIATELTKALDRAKVQ